jgi:RNA polymerase sigma factor (sigma-70 family)
MAMPETVPIFDDPGDTELLASAMRGSKAALNTLADRHYNGVLLYLASQSITPEQASDLTQETFYDLFRSLDSITPDRPLRAWLLVAARNNLLHHLRQERFRTHASFDQILEQGVRPPRQFAIDDPALQLIDEETLRTILDELNTNLRDVLMLIGEGYSIKEIAQMLDIDYPAARKRTSRAMRYVRERYTELGVFPKEPR